MLGEGFREDEDVVEVYDEVGVEEVVEYVIHEALEGCWCVSEAKRHDQHLVEAIACLECRFPFVAFSYPHVVVTGSKVELGEDLCTLQSVCDLLGEG